MQFFSSIVELCCGCHRLRFEQNLEQGCQYHYLVSVYPSVGQFLSFCRPMTAVCELPTITECLPLLCRVIVNVEDLQPVQVVEATDAFSLCVNADLVWTTTMAHTALMIVRQLCLCCVRSVSPKQSDCEVNINPPPNTCYYNVSFFRGRSFKLVGSTTKGQGDRCISSFGSLAW
jgi:hypothetical protein